MPEPERDVFRELQGASSPSAILRIMHRPLERRWGTASGAMVVLICILACYACARVLEIVPTHIPRTAIITLDVLSAMAFALTDGARTFGLRTILVFTAICIVVGNIIENLGVATGFPYGRYVFVELMGPKLFHVPVLLGLAYIGMAYVSWNIAALILMRFRISQAGPAFFALPALASVVMTAWDLAQDPVWATVLHGWIWRDGGRWFGVPLSNYCGWLATVFTIYLLFALYLDRRGVSATAPARMQASPRAVAFYALCAAGNILQTIPRADPSLVADPTGKLWRVADILRASALVSIFVMGSFVALACLQASRKSAATD